jgi:hypothetical protein
MKRERVILPVILAVFIFHGSLPADAASGSISSTAPTADPMTVRAETAPAAAGSSTPDLPCFLNQTISTEQADVCGSCSQYLCANRSLGAPCFFNSQWGVCDVIGPACGGIGGSPRCQCIIDDYQ